MIAPATSPVFEFAVRLGRGLLMLAGLAAALTVGMYAGIFMFAIWPLVRAP